VWVGVGVGVSVGLCVGVSGVGGCVGGFMCRWMGQCWSTHAFSHVRGAQSRDDERH